MLGSVPSSGVSLLLSAAGSEEEYYCASTLPNQFASVQQPNSRCMRVPPPPPLPDSTKGFVPAVSIIQQDQQRV